MKTVSTKEHGERSWGQEENPTSKAKPEPWHEEHDLAVLQHGISWTLNFKDEVVSHHIPKKDGERFQHVAL